MTDPQSQSPLFRISRELRDMIYIYYVQQEHGYCYGHKYGKLKGNDCILEQNLPATWKVIAEEMKRIQLKSNEITITSDHAEGDQSVSYDIRGRAKHFHDLMVAVVEAKNL